MKAVGLDLGGTNLRGALVDVATGQLASPELKLPVADKHPDALARLAEELVRQVDPRAERVGVGVGFAGMLRGESGVVINAPNFGWREVDFRTPLRNRVGARAELYNDLNAIAFGEARYGGARALADVLCVYIGTGVGAGLVTRGDLYIGSNNLAGEMGHVKVMPGGRRCGCGARGCLEAYTSGVHIQARAREELAAGAASLAIELAGSLDRLHAGHLDEAAQKGDGYATALWDEVARILGTALANAVTLLNPSRLVLGGGVWKGAPELRRRTLLAFKAAANAPSLEGFAVGDTTLGDGAGVLGAAALISRSSEAK